LGDPQALPELSRVYREDDNKQVREAAAKALKQFAAKEGGAKRSFLKPLVPLLSLSLLLLLVLNGLIWGAGIGRPVEPSTPTPIPTPWAYNDLFATLQNDVIFALDDINTVGEQWNAGAGNLNCEGVTLQSPPSCGVSEVDQYVYG